MSRNERMMLGVVAAISWVGLLLQADVSFRIMLEEGVTFSDAVIRFFSYFTVLTNSLIALDCAICFVTGESRWTRSLLHSSLETCLAVSIFSVAIDYTILLRHLLHLSGIAALADTILHYVVPALFLFHWALFSSKHKLPWTHAGWWVLYPLLYFVYALVQGWRTSFYPYPFIDARRIGYDHALLDGTVLLIFFGLGSLLFIGVGRLIHRPSRGRVISSA